MAPRSSLVAGAALLGAAAGCSPGGGGMAGQGAFAPAYLGIETQLLDVDLVNFIVQMRRVRDESDLSAYADCAAAQYALIRGYGFARHVRTNVSQEGGLWRADAVYTISPTLPRGIQQIDAEVVVANCADEGIPTV